MRTTYLSTIGAALFAVTLGACNKTQTVAPEQGGKRGEQCQARNDCEKGLACIQNVCSRNDFKISATAKQCDVVECETTEDCCGDKPTSAPAKCSGIPSICQTPNVPGCIQTSCTADAECGGGTCGAGRCGTTFATCTSDADCADFCDTGACFNSGFFCTVDSDCASVCESRVCDCDNPQFNPADPICSDPDCQDVCTLRCDEERCVADDSCESDLDCPFNAPMCDGGRCIECAGDDDCEDDEACLNGFCNTPCTQNEECPLFHACEDGECVETGCTSDRECVLAFTGETREDARLAKCLPADAENATPECKIPCENDGSCAEFQVCEKGYCKFIGCNENEECRAFLALENQNPDGDAPFIPQAVCR